MGIREIRKELNLTQAGFARLFGVHQTAVSQWETGRTSPDTEMAVHIARATGHSVDEVLGVHIQNALALGEETAEIEMPDDRMAGARIFRGDRVYIRPSDRAPMDGSLIGVSINGNKTVRFVRFMDGEKFWTDACVPAAIEKAKDGDRILGNVVGLYVDFEKEDA